MYEIQDDVFLHSIQCNAKQSEDQQLDWADLSQQRTVGDQASSHTEICVDQAEERKPQMLRTKYPH